MIAYKIVNSKKQSYISDFLPHHIRCQYGKNIRTVPTVGKLFAYRELNYATTSFYSMNILSRNCQLWKCKIEESINQYFPTYYLTNTTFLNNGWKNPTITNKHFVLCDSITLLTRIFEYDNNLLVSQM